MPQDAMKASLKDSLGRTRVKRRWCYSKNGDTALYSVVTLRKSVRILSKFRLLDNEGSQDRCLCSGEYKQENIEFTGN